MMLHLRPMKSDVNAPTAHPTMEPTASTTVYPKDWLMVRPCRMKNCGRKITKPKIRVLMVISTQLPTNMRWRSGGVSSFQALTWGSGVAEITGGGKGPPAEASFSIAWISASASSVRPFDSSQRGDSGSALRIHHTISEPTPAMTNIGRQPNAGTM